MLEDDVIDKLVIWLERDGWEIEDCCKGKKRGIDILAKKGKRSFIIEAKGAWGNPDNNSSRQKFSSSQVNTHFGVAILKVLRERIKHPGARVAIAHPDIPYIKERVLPLKPDLHGLKIQLLWVRSNGQVIVEV